MKRLSIALCALIAMACSSSKDQQALSKAREVENEKQPNIILMIGDGMGLSQISSLYVFDDQFDDQPISFDRFSNTGIINTSSSSHKITDSAAGATAFACGQKSYNRAIGVGEDTVAIENIVEVLSKQNWNTGLVATSSITHATPAAFFAHVSHRNMGEAIAAQLPASEIDLFIGGGLKFFNQREDGINYLDSLAHYGFTVYTDGLQNSTAIKEGASQKKGFLLAGNAMAKHSEGRGNFLKDATSYAIEELSAREESFFLMIEGSQIDWGGHANDSDYIFSEMKDFDQAIHAALDFAEKDGNTLVIVTADHETGGYALVAGETAGKSDYNVVKGSFSTGGHSAALIPVFAHGPGAERFNGVYQNSAIYDKMMALVKERNPAL